MEIPINGSSRRRFLKLTGTAAALIPLVNLAGCGAEEPGGELEGAQPQGSTPEPGTRPTGAPQQSAPSGTGQQSQGQAGQGTQAGQAQGGQAAQDDPASGALVQLEESNPQAQALGYKHDASDVDKSAYPAYQQGQLCSNCNLYRPEMGEQPWGGCQIFPGKLVHAAGWCSAYVPTQQT